MRWHLKHVIGALIGILGSAGASATVPDFDPGRFQAIPQRNLFGLRSAPEVPRAQPQPAALPKIVLTGITTILGNKRALMKEQPVGAKPGNPAQERSLILTEGQRDGAIEVLAIDERTGVVTVNNSGTVVTLTFEKDGAKLPSTPPPIPGARAPAVAASATPPSANAYIAPVNPNPNSRQRTLPTRNLRLRSNANTPAPAAGDVPPPTGYGYPSASPQLPEGTPLTREQEDQELLRLQRDAALLDPNILSAPNPVEDSVTPPANAAPDTTGSPPPLPQ